MLSECHRDSKRAYLTALAVFALYLTSSLAVSRPAAWAFQFSEDPVRIEGAVYGQHGSRVPSARVKLESDEGDQLWETGLDDQGRYGFAGLRRGLYQLVVTADGYETFRETVDLTRSPSHTIIDLTLTPVPSGGGQPESLTDGQAPRKARSEYEKGVRALAAHRIPEAKAHFAKAVREYPCYARAQTAEALSLISDRDLNGAEAALKKAIDCDSGFTSAYLKLGELYNAELRFNDSQRVLENGLRLDPALWKFHYNLGIAYFGTGSYDKAEGEYLRAESLTPPAPPEVHLKLADVYFKEKQWGRAYAEMKAYLAADPNGEFAGKVTNLMAQMRAARRPAAGAPAPTADSKR